MQMSFPTHFRRHIFVYLMILCFMWVAALTLFQLTEPKSDAPRLLLIEDGGAIPSLPFDGTVRYASAETSLSPEAVQTYVLMTGGGTFDIFCAPVRRAPEFWEQQLIRPLTDAPENAVCVGSADVAVPVNDDYALFLAASAKEGTEETLLALSQTLP